MPQIWKIVAGRKKGGGGPIEIASCAIAAYDFSLFIDPNNTTWSWGRNDFGQLGDNSLTNKPAPVSVLGAKKTFCQISAGTSHAAVIDKDGRAWTWGANNGFQLGDGTTFSKLTPVSVGGATKTFCYISAGNARTMAIDKNGQASGWGNNSTGQLGDNSITNRCTPVSVLGLAKTFCQIRSLGGATIAIDKNGKVWGWGDNTFGMIGDNSTTAKCTPVSVCGTTKTFCKIATGFYHTVAIDKDGRAWGWGWNRFGDVGDNSATQRNTPVSVAGVIKTFCQISAGIYHTVAIDKNGQAWGWGRNNYGQLGDNSITCRCTPVSVAGATKTFCQIAGGSDHTIAVDKNANVWAWGYNVYGQLGDDNADKRTPISVCGTTKTFCQIAATAFHTFGIDKNGRAWAWGANYYGEIGDNSTTNRGTPVSVAGATKTFCKVATGASGGHSIAIDKNGKAWSWGYNNVGQLGDNSILSRRTPVSVAGGTKTFCEIAVGYSHSCAIDKNGRAWCWGLNSTYQLGTGNTVSYRTPISVGGTSQTFCKIALGTFHTMAIDYNGRAWGWGSNFWGQVGDGTGFNCKTLPVSVAGAVKTFCHISAGTCTTVAIDKNGKVWGWGYSTMGQIGNNAINYYQSPVSVCGVNKTFCEISSNYLHTVAIDKNGIVWAWGWNLNGQLGNNSIVNRCTPVSVTGATKTFCKVQTGVRHTVAIDKNGRAWAWGQVANFALGNDYKQSQLTPVRVCNL
jgi:alpha-tubulin suppressor-like RCC1 family protein